MAKYLQGFFKPKFPAKYKGNPTTIVFRSSWEFKLMSHFDLHQDVVWWSSEERIIPYRSPVDNRMHRYFPDFLINTKNKQGIAETLMIEVKPAAQTIEPKKQTAISKKYLKEVFTYGVNISKWSAAEEYCKDRGWRFMLMTEREIFGK
jgi:hypothetical protein